MLTRRTVLAGSLLTAAPVAARAQGAAPSAAKDDGIIRVPIEVRHNQPWTSVWLDGKGPLRFAIDTGDAAGYTIDRKLAEAMGLNHAFAGRLVGVTGDARVETFQAKEVIIGGVLRDNGRVFLPKEYSGFTVGLLPAQLLRLLPCDLDFAGGELRLYQTGKPSREGWERVHLLAQDGAAFIIDVLLDGERYRMGVDTGDEEAVTIFAAAVRRRNLWDRYPKWIENRAYGVLEAADERVVRLKTLTLGAHEMPNPVVHMIDPSAHDRHEGLDGLIGMETLRRFALSFDTDENALWIKANGALRQPFRYDRSGMKLAGEQGHAVVLSITPESGAAKAGLVPGDRLYKTGPDFRWRLQDGPGTVVEFEADRSGQRRPITLVLKDLI